MNRMKIPPTGWIWTGTEETSENKLFHFRKELSLDILPETALINISADTRYRLYINGVSVSFGPCKGDDQVWYYETVDIAPYLQVGQNIICASVLRLSPIPTGNHSIWRTPYPGFYLKGDLCESASGETTPIYADETWKWIENTATKFVPEVAHSIYLDIFEVATGNPTLQGWQYNNFDDSNWNDAIPYSMFQSPRMPMATSPANLHPRPVPPMFERTTRFTGIKEIRQSGVDEQKWHALISGNSLELATNTEHIIEIDAGELTTGFLMFEFAGGAGTAIEILTSEAYVYPPAEKTVFSRGIKGDRTDSKNGYLEGFTDHYTVGGFGDEQSPEYYEPFWFRTFRFTALKIKVGAQPLKISDFSYRETGYPLEAKTTVETSDPTLTPIWDISLRTLRRCMHETYEDCPFYEQLQYAMDARTQILYTYAVSADDRMARRTIDDYHRSLRYDGLTNCCWPTVSGNVIPGFSLFYIMMIHDHMMHFGDQELVRRYLPTVDAILEFFHRNLNEQGLVGQVGGIIRTKERWSFIDWTTHWERTAGVPDAILQGPITMESFLYIYGLQMASELSEFVSKNENAGDYLKRAETVKMAINQHCQDEDGFYLDGPSVLKYSQHCQVWAVLTETAPKEKWAQIIRKSLKEDWPKCSVAMAFELFRALEKADIYEETNALWEPWREMVKNNLTTCQENDVDARSDCHAWGALALYEIPSVILGVRPAKPGFSAISVKPNPAYFDWAKGCVHTPKGEIQVEWERNGDDIKVNVIAPDGVEIIS